MAVDSRNRVSLSKLIQDHISSVTACLLEDGKILLTPMVEVPVQEAWLYKNRAALESVERGLSQEPAIDLGSFSEYVEEEKE